MKRLLHASAALGALVTIAGAASAQCAIDGEGSVRILSNDFAALHIIADRASECASDAVEVTRNQTAEHKTIQGPALTTNPADYTVAVIANNSVVPLLNEGLIRPLDDLVAQYGEGLLDSQLIRIDGQIMAIAFMANSQHSFWRPSLLEQAGLQPPTTYEEMLSNAEALRSQGIMENPIASTMATGWDLAQEFVNMYTGHGGEFFEAGTANLAIENEQGMAALEMMKALTEYMGPDFLTYNTNSVKPIWEAGEIAMHNGWGSRAGAFIDPAEGYPEIAADTAFGASPTVGGGTIPASTLWWDGFSIAKNISDEDAAVSFQAMMHAMSPELLEDPQQAAAAVWLIEGYEPTPASVGVIANLEAGTRPYPMNPYMGLLHTALGDNLSEFMQGQESAEQALADVNAAYTDAARQAGYIQ